jgi:hypothetical protein
LMMYTNYAAEKCTTWCPPVPEAFYIIYTYLLIALYKQQHREKRNKVWCRLVLKKKKKKKRRTIFWLKKIKLNVKWKQH